MTDFIKKHKVLSGFAAAFLMIVLIVIFAGHTIWNFTIEQTYQMKTKNKTVCTINPQNATQINYDGQIYQILNTTVSDSEIGGWNGVIHKYAILDDRYRIRKQDNLNIDFDVQMKDVIKNLQSNDKYVVVYYNVFAIKNTDEKNMIAVGLLSGTYKAVPVDTTSAGKNAIQFQKEARDKIRLLLK